MPVVTMPDGTAVNMPDQIDPALGARLRAFNEDYKAKNAPKVDDSAGHMALGALENLGSQVASMPGHFANAVNDLASRATGGAFSPAKIPDVNTGEAGRDFDTVTNRSPVSQAVTGALNKGDTALDSAVSGVSPTAADVLHQAAGVLSDVQSIAPAAGVTKGVTGALSKVVNAPGLAESLGLRTAENAPLARNVAGSSGREALNGANGRIINAAGGVDAGVPVGTDVTYDSLAAAREAPNAVYSRVARGIAPSDLAQDATFVGNARTAGLPAGGRVTAGSPQAQTQIEALRSQLLGAGVTTGEQKLNELRGLRQEGSTNLASDDISNQQLGQAQLDMARALEDHIGRNIPPGSDVSLDQFQAARKALAKNFTVQSALRGTDIDPQALARIQRADPGLLDGHIGTIADFANNHPEVASLPSAGARYSPPSILKDMGNFDIMHPVGSAARVLGGGPIARRALTGDTQGAIDRLRGPSSSQFDPLHPELSLQPPPGTAYEAHQPAIATGAAPERSFSDSLTPGSGGRLSLQQPEGEAFGQPHQPQLGTGATKERSLAEMLNLEPPPGEAFGQPHQPQLGTGATKERSLAEMLNLEPPPGEAFGQPHQPDLGTGAEKDRSLFDQLNLQPPPGQAFEPHQRPLGTDPERLGGQTSLMDLLEGKGDLNELVHKVGKASGNHEPTARDLMDYLSGQ